HVFSFLIVRPPPRSTLFPYTTLFRSPSKLFLDEGETRLLAPKSTEFSLNFVNHVSGHFGAIESLPAKRIGPQSGAFVFLITSIRSEEHTSELQSRGHLVCRLLLEKKK